MLNTIPTDFWTTPKKVFEPCSGKGGFVLDIVSRFMEGLKDLILDENERYRVIVEECLYWCDIKPTNVFICKLLLDPYNQYNLKYHERNTLELDINVKWEIEGFDAVIGKPPYQETDKNNKSKGGTNLYTKFINFSFNNISIDGLLLFITPISWLGPSTNKQMGGDILHNIFLMYDLLYLNLNECKKYFNVGSTFSYYIIKKSITSNLFTTVKSEYNKQISINSINFKNLFHFKFLPIHINNYTIDLINEIISKPNKIKIERCRQLDSSSINTKKHLNLEKNEKFKYITYHTTSKTYYSDIKLDIFDNTKILLNMAGYLKPEIVNNCNITESKFFILINDDNERRKILDLLNSDKIIEYLLLCKYSGFNSRPVIESITFD